MTETLLETPQRDRLWRLETLDDILVRVDRETGPDRKLDAALWTLIRVFAAEGASIIGLDANEPEVLHECGPGASATTDAAARLIAATAEPDTATNPDGRQILAARCGACIGGRTGVAVWRDPGAAAWTHEETRLAGATTRIISLILEYEGVRRELSHQARTDSLTGLLNRRAFQEELGRHLVRLDRENLPGTLLALDLDGFKAVNDRWGHAAGDQMLLAFADMIQKLFRPTDLIGREGGDEFAVWLSGADQMTAAERADDLCKQAPVAFARLLPDAPSRLGVSVGIAMRQAGSDEGIDSLMRRADSAMYEVKRTGGRHWRVSLAETT